MQTEPLQTPLHCPGTESEQAGRDSACEGCPNQEICQSRPKGPDPDIPLITEALKDIRHKVLILSGKGGVGKSTFTSLLAALIADAEVDKQFGMIDIDFCGPSLARIAGVQNEQCFGRDAKWTPVYAESNLGVMSISHMLPTTDQPVIWRGDKKTGLIKQFLTNVDWGEEGLDMLFVDTPPGTSDEHISLAQYLKPSGGYGALIVTTPQEVALQDVRKQIDFCQKAGIPIFGIVENMAGFVCPSCGGKSDIFVAGTGGGRALAEETGVPFMGSVPLDPRVGMCADSGKDFLTDYSASPATLAIKNVAVNLLTEMGIELPEYLEEPEPAIEPAQKTVAV
mgnify:FL=1